MNQPASILPRAPISAAKRIAAEVLGAEPNPLAAPLTRHPAAALRRRLTWATIVSATLALMLWWIAATTPLPYWIIWIALGLWPLTLGAAVIAYRALGHTIVGSYLVTRSGLTSRGTYVLQRSAVSTIVVRESLLQRRLGLKTVSTMTAAGWGGYDTPDMESAEALSFADQAAPGILEPFLLADDDQTH